MHESNPRVTRYQHLRRPRYAFAVEPQELKPGLVARFTDELESRDLAGTTVTRDVPADAIALRPAMFRGIARAVALSESIAASSSLRPGNS